MPHLGDLIRELREDAGMNVRELARASGVDSSIISRLEGHKQATTKGENVAKLAQALGTTADALIKQSQQPNNGAPVKRAWPTLEEWLRRDPNLTDRQRATVLEVYRSYVER